MKPNMKIFDSEKKINVGGGYISQLVVVILYLGGMLLNYFVLSDVVEREQFGNVRGDINFYISKFYSQWDDAMSGKVSIGGIFKEITNSDRYNGTFSIMTPDGSIIFNSEGHEGNAFKNFYEDFGQTARDLLADQLKNPKEQGWVQYSDNYSTATYIRYDKERNVVFFYQFDPSEIRSRTSKAYYLLFFIFLLGGVIIIFVCFMNVRKMSEKLRQEFASKRDLDTAAEIQASMLPKGHRQLMQVDISASLVPAQGVGGDFYYYTLRHGRLYFCIGDVSGKGIPASLTMSRSVTLFRSMAEEELPPSRITSRMNMELCANNDKNIFVTAIIGVMNVWDGKIAYCNAGHGKPLYWNGIPDSGCTFIPGQGGLPMGFDMSSQYDEYVVDFEANGMMLFCTDGVNEAYNKKKNLYGFDRLVAFADKNRSLPAAEINAALLEDINLFADGAHQSDDITILTFRNIARPKILEIRNEIKELRKISGFLEGIFKECPLDDKNRIKVRAGLDEALTNCVLYAYPDSRGIIQLSASIENHCLVFTLMDSGIEFDVVSHESSMTGEIKVGGLGIAMIKASFDKVKYDRINGKNVLRMIKNI